MAFQILSFFTIFMFMIIALKIRNHYKKYDFGKNIPPGPWKLPILGNILHLVATNPPRRLRDLAKKYGPLMHLQLGEIFFIVISSPEVAKEVLKTHDIIFASRPHLLATDIASYNSMDIAFSPYGDYWRQLRKICAIELLSTRRVKSLWPVRQKEINSLLKKIASNEGSEFNLTEEVMSTMYTFTSKAAFGKKYLEQEEFISVVKQLIKLAGGFYIGDLFPSAQWIQNISGLKPKLEKLSQQVDRILGHIITDHKEKISRRENEGLPEAEEDLIDCLLKFVESGSDMDFELTIDNVKAIILDVFSAGSETAATTVNWAMAEMIKDPRILKKAQAEVRNGFDRRGMVDEATIAEFKYLKSIIKESLRLHPSVPLLLPRESREACEINGYRIPVKSRVLINAWAMGRDPKYWNDPDKFYPERFIDSSIDFSGTNFEFIPFGAGRRICPGMNYGLANVEQVLALLLYHFDWKLPNGMKNEELELGEEFGVTMARKGDLYLIPITSHQSLVI
ncbi:putative cytochrome P450 [Medicago truncatula]|uniref:Putative cytochrome P450 n=1 Tax=Medicago truncatula TaxID=3880 RepID=A0A396HDC2_MEDTR|nr:cytochrome P450 71D11-like [Medicago truncatula]RHN51236.1 putative cytochrome P450 [Medicago truncatula]